MTTLLFDLETDGLLEEVTKIHCLVIHNPEAGDTFKFTSEDTQEAFRVGLEMLEEADLIVGHNIVRFDIPVIQKFYPWFKPRGKVRDTLVMAKLVWPNLKVLDKAARIEGFPGGLVGRHSLEAWGWRLGNHKGAFAKQTDWKTFTPEMLEYCVQDVVGPTAALWHKIESKKYSADALQTEHDFAYVMFLQEQHGFRFDLGAAQKLHSTLVKRRLELEASLQTTFKGWWEDMKTPEYWEAFVQGGPAVAKKATKGEAMDSAWALAKAAGLKRKAITVTPGPMAKKHTPFNPASRDHVARVLKEAHGWAPKQFTDGGKAQIDETVLEGLEYPEAKLLLEYFMLEKRLGQLAEGDNAWLRLVSAESRMHGQVDPGGTVTGRCTHMRPNMGQIPACDKPFGPECRALFLPNEGHVLVGADASGIQLRALAHYLARWDGGQYVELVTTGDVHTANQQAAGIPTRDMAKTFIYAWLLGAGDAKIGRIVGKGTKAGRELKQRFLKNLPAFKKLKDRIAARIDQTHSIVGLDGRVLPCESAHLALGSLLQGFEAVVMKKATWLLYSDLMERGYRHGEDFGFCVMVHDEWQLSCRKEIADEVGRAAVSAIIRAGEDLGSKCPLAGEYKVGGDWAETH